MVHLFKIGIFGIALLNAEPRSLYLFSLCAGASGETLFRDQIAENSYFFLSETKVLSGLTPSTFILFSIMSIENKVGKKRKFENVYKVSNKGRILTARGRKTYGHLDKSGYRVFAINKKQKCVHRLVASAFLDSPGEDQEYQVNHKDLNRQNNCVTNLEWVTRSQNCQHAVDSGQRSRDYSARSNPILACKIGTGKWVRYASVAGAARDLNLLKSCVWETCKGKTNQTGGYIFRYADTVERYLPGEVWKQVSESNIKVSNFGRVWHLHGNQINWGSRNAKGYMKTRFGTKSAFVHRLVAKYFIGDPPSAYQVTVNHKDMDTTNNHVENLEWASAKEQLQHALENNRSRSSSGAGQSKVVFGRLLGTLEWNLKFLSQTEANRALMTNVGACCRGRDKWARSKKDGQKYEFKWEEQPDLPGEEWRLVKSHES